VQTNAGLIPESNRAIEKVQQSVYGRLVVLESKDRKIGRHRPGHRYGMDKARVSAIARFTSLRLQHLVYGLDNYFGFIVSQ
jgi:hypothetical protein